MIIKDLFTTACLLTGQTERATHRLGVSFFLPELFRLRYANMGQLDAALFGRQLDELRSFADSVWCGYWNRIAGEHEAEAEKPLASGRNEAAHAALIKATTYYTVSAFPGHTPERMEAYRKARQLSDRLAPLLDEHLELKTIETPGARVSGYLRLPPGPGRHPIVIITNGLEGTVQEISLPLMKYRDSDLGVFLMEMPGTYDDERPMSGESEQIYNAVIEHLAAHPRVDAERMAMVGVSFGGYWSARMAAVSPRLRCAVVCGAPLERAFCGAQALGTPEIFVAALRKVLGAKSLKDLRQKLAALSFARNDLFRRIHLPLLIINGERDTLLGTEDAVLLHQRVQGSILKLYAGDDHCAMGHYREWLDLSFTWLAQQLGEPAGIQEAKA
jgi:esterase FrsA